MASIATSSIAQTSELVWAGLVQEAFTIDGDEVWTVEDGGRIRHRDASGAWTSQATPALVEDSLRRVFFLDDGLTGWAVGLKGWLLETSDGGIHWTEAWSFASPSDPSGFEDLWDTVWLDALNGYVLGLHGIWRTSTGSALHPWLSAEFWSSTNPAIAQQVNPETLELYSLDIHPNGLALACGEPGVIFKRNATNLDRWELIFDATSLCSAPPTPCNVGAALPPCVRDDVCCGGANLELWDVKISRHPTEPLIIVVGGTRSDCGAILTSTDNAQTWVWESHECECSWLGCTPCTGDPDYRDDGGPNETWRWRRYLSLYGVGILPTDNTAIACAYGGQIVVRDRADADPNAPGVQCVWRDRSARSTHPLDTPAAVNLPGYGVATNGGDGVNGKAVVTNMGGFIRRSADGGQTWTTEAPGEQWRLRDVHFVSTTDGFMVTQFQRVARTVNGGVTWTPEQSGAEMSAGLLRAIAVDAGGLFGVAVGDSKPGKWPTVRVNGNVPNSIQWIPPANDPIPAEPGLIVSEALDEVAWASGQEFWAVGGQGLILHSNPVLGLDSWSQYVPSDETYADFADFNIAGVAFSGAANGVFVGQRTPLGVSVAKAYHRKSSAPDKFFEVAVSGLSNVTSLTDVAFDGSTAYATGVVQDANGPHGVVLVSTLSGGSFSDFVPLGGLFDECLVGEAPTAVEVLTEVEIAPGGAPWIGGQCGRLWKWDGAAWLSIRSMTDAHVQGMSFPATDHGYVAGHRSNRTGSSLVRVTP